MAVVLITGCNSGLGMAGALAFARRGDTVVGTVRERRRGDVLLDRARTEGLAITIEILDVTQPDTFAPLIKKIVAAAGSLDVLVNNAGILLPGALEDLSEDAIRAVMETNFFGPILLSRAALPQMRKQGSGRIIMISSLSGLAGLAGDVAYSASKFALEGATEALRHEVDRWGIQLALVEPGQYATELFRNMEALPKDYPKDSPYRPLVSTKLAEIQSGQQGALPPEQVGDLLPDIADADGSQLRWPADDTARHVLGSMHGQDDGERDKFLRGAAGCDWWSDGLQAPPQADE